MNDPSPNSRQLLPTGEARIRRRRIRRGNDVASRLLITTAGFGVVVALATIFIYLFSEVMPILKAATVEVERQYPAPGSVDETVHLAADRHVEAPSRFTRSGEVTFYEPADGSVLARYRLAVPDGVVVTSFATAELRTGIIAYGLSDGTALVARHAYRITYPDDVRHVEPYLEFPFGDAPVVVDERGAPLHAVAVQEGPGGISLAAVTLDNRLLLARYRTQVSFMTGETVVTRTGHTLPGPPGLVDHLLVDITARNLYAASRDGRVTYYDISDPAQAEVRETRRVLRNPDAELTAFSFLLGAVSLIAGGSDGTVAQWMPVRDDDNLYYLTHIRDFPRHGAAVTAVQPEHSRKGFITAAANGELAIHYSTSHRTVYRGRPVEHAIAAVAVAPRDDALMLVDDRGGLHMAALWNEHPEISFSALWRRVWYEGRSGSEFVWQASSATDEFERKFSMVPLTLGTIKAAFYAMLFAIPIAVFGAVYSAYFMTPRMRNYVKPTIEVMEALPTVILGFLAGLWLAPFVENNLPSVFTIVLLLPLVVLGFGWVWTNLPRSMRYLVPDGWEAALLVAPIILVGWGSVAVSPFIELALFDGDMRQWFTDFGVTYDQRNALVVGIAMGFAVIPTIFSIAEDAVFTVPKHLTQGSLALGATRWQTVTRVVLLTASPGIFSAVMIGMGRAVGETMIVLMATGNSPVVNFNIFEGMRTLSANIAVELPETSVGGTHFRILFLAALLLFAATFLLNTVAEIVRQRLRARYSQL